MEKNTEPIATSELSTRETSGLTVTLWWVHKTLNTYVTVESTPPLKKGDDPVMHRIDVLPPASPNDVFMHPFGYMQQANES